VIALSASLSLSIADAAMGQRKRTTSPKPSSGSVIPYESQIDPVFQMTRATFIPYVETKFIIDPGYTFPIEMTLIEVKDLRSAADKKRNLPGKECFMITFRPPEDTALKQGTYQIKHDALGTFELFIVPVTNKAGDIFFEAVINRMNP
jgi:hypothetical protein